MTVRILFACVALFVAQYAALAFAPQQAAASARAASFSLAGTPYFHRFTKDDLHEFTPKGQENLDAWTDMITVNVYRAAKDGEGLAATANAVLETYKANEAQILKTDSVPATAARPAEHLIVALFTRPEFVEVAFARFRLSDGIGTAAIYSHRVYGKQAGDAMGAWLQRNGRTTELNLMKWDAMPGAKASWGDAGAR